MPIESTLSKAFMARAAIQFPTLRLFRRNVGVMKIEERVFKAGIKGQADMYGYLRGGKVVEIEAKSATGRLNPEQERWRDWCLEWGIPWLLIEARKGEFGTLTVARWCEELAEFLRPLIW